MRVVIDQLKCNTIGICVKEAPDIFQFLPGSKKATVVFEQIPEHLREKCLAIANKCPNNAILVVLENEIEE